MSDVRKSSLEEIGRVYLHKGLEIEVRDRTTDVTPEGYSQLAVCLYPFWSYGTAEKKNYLFHHVYPTGDVAARERLLNALLRDFTAYYSGSGG